MKLTSARCVAGLEADLPRGRRAAAALRAVLRPLGRVEDHDVAHAGVAEARADAVDQHALADLERRHHRLRRDPVRLDEERLDAERETERDRDDQHQLQQGAGRGRAGLVPGHAYFASSSDAAASVASASSTAAGSAGSAASGAAASVASTSSTSTSDVRRLGERLLVDGVARHLAVRRRRDLGRGIVQQTRLDALLGPGVAALADAGALADPAAQVVELCAPHVTAGRDLDPLDLRRVHGERALHADAEGLLADREGLAHALALALDDHALEHLGPAARALDDLEVDADAIARLELGDAAQLGALESVDDRAHGKENRRRRDSVARRIRIASRRRRDGATARGAIRGSARGGR